MNKKNKIILQIIPFRNKCNTFNSRFTLKMGLPVAVYLICNSSTVKYHGFS